MQNTLHQAWYHNFKERQTVTLHWHHPQPPRSPQSGPWCSQLHGCKKSGPHPAPDKCLHRPPTPPSLVPRASERQSQKQGRVEGTRGDAQSISEGRKAVEPQ